VFPPSFRVDLEREVDIVEEIARLYGYNNIPSTLPIVPMSFSEQEPVRLMRNRIAAQMTSMGFIEAINYSFIAQQHFDLLGLAAEDGLRNTVQLLNPLSEDQGVMRTTLLPGLLDNVRHNLNRQNSDLRLFEIGKVFHPQKGEELPGEVVRLAAVFTGRRNPGSSLLHFGEKKADIYDVIGTVEELCRFLKITGVDFDKTGEKPPYAGAESSLTVRKDATAFGLLGAFETTALEKFGIKQEVYFLDLDLTQVMTLKPQPLVFAPLSKFPTVKWDLAIIVPEAVGGGDMIKEILASRKPYIVNAEIFDIYRGKAIKNGCKSVAIKITYHSFEQTLDDDLVKGVHQQVIDMLLSRFEGQLREI
jgi:phenylalanyl-tRNA synthetase beta chain